MRVLKYYETGNCFTMEKGLMGTEQLNMQVFEYYKTGNCYNGEWSHGNRTVKHASV